MEVKERSTKGREKTIKQIEAAAKGLLETARERRQEQEQLEYLAGKRDKPSRYPICGEKISNIQGIKVGGVKAVAIPLEEGEPKMFEGEPGADNYIKFLEGRIKIKR